MTALVRILVMEKTKPLMVISAVIETSRTLSASILHFLLCTPQGPTAGSGDPQAAFPRGILTGNKMGSCPGVWKKLSDKTLQDIAPAPSRFSWQDGADTAVSSSKLWAEGTC